MNCHYCKADNREDDRHCAECRRPVTLDKSGKNTPAPIQKLNIPVVFDENTLFDGVTQVKVFRKDVDERTRRETIRQIHEGVVLGQTSKYVRVYNPLAPDSGGDISPELAQLFPISSPCCWIEIIGRQKPMTMPASLR